MIPELIKEFLVESHEGLDRLDRDLIALEQDPANRDTLGRIFRAIHTIKGTCGFFGFQKLESVSHAGENLLSRLRDGEQMLDAASTTGLLTMVDALREILAAIEATAGESDGAGDYRAVIALLETLTQPLSLSPPDTARAARDDRREDRRDDARDEAVSAADGPGPERGADAAREPAGECRSAVSDSSLRVDVGLIDRLMNLVGELVLARNQILQFTSTQTDAGFLGATQRLNMVTSELQAGVMKTRMQPIGNIWAQYPRVVRDLALQCGKRVRLQMDGTATELDKTIIEAVKDPLVHVIRNAVDHGIETPSTRRAAGKPEEGTIRLRAFHAGGQINIEIADDGAGIDLERVRAKAIQRGLITTEAAARLGIDETVALIFLPGFSTAERITNVSGRGVGMDVVKTNVEKIGGSVNVQNRPGEGTMLRIKIPLTLAIIPALMVTSGGERFAIPQVSLLELVRLEGEQARAGLERIETAQFYRLRGHLLPIVHLNDQLRLAPAGDGEVINIVVLQSDGRQFGLVVDAINDTEEIVVKPLGRSLKAIAAFAGATIMGDGRIALILDVLGLAQRARVVAAAAVRPTTDADGDTDRADRGGDVQTLLLFRVGARRLAMPLTAVDRLEEFGAGDIERAGGVDAIQYRGEILSLLPLAAWLGETPAVGDPRQVIVTAAGGRRVGLVVDRILDVVTEAVSVQRVAPHRALAGSAVVGGRITDLIDLSAVRAALDPHLEPAHVA